MGSTTITYALVALASGLVCLVSGFLWGRSNLKSSVERAVEEGAASLDTREFAMRKQLDEAIDEIARLRPLAEELERVQDRLKREQSKYQHMKAEFDATLNNGAPAQEFAGENQAQPPEVTPESADEAIQRLLQSLETLNQPEAPPIEERVESAIAQAPTRSAVIEPAPIVESTPTIQPQAPPAPLPSETRLPQQTRPKAPKPVVTAVPMATAMPVAQAPLPTQQAHVQGDDEWQEFARSLAALTRKQ